MEIFLKLINVFTTRSFKRNKEIRLEHLADWRVKRKWDREAIIVRYNLKKKKRWVAILLYYICLV